MQKVKNVHSFFRITRKNYRRKRKADRRTLWQAYGEIYRGMRGVPLDPIKYFVCSQNKLVYIVNSKAGCSSIKQAMMASSETDVCGENYWDVHRIGVEQGYSKPSLSDVEKEYFFFTFVRSPFSRLASLYLNKFCNHQHISINGFEYKSYLGGVFDRNDSFERFLGKVSKIPDILCYRHFKPQVYLVNHEAIKIDFVGKLENLKADYDRLRDRFPLRDLKVINKSPSSIE